MRAGRCWELRWGSARLPSPGLSWDITLNPSPSLRRCGCRMLRIWKHQLSLLGETRLPQGPHLLGSAMQATCLMGGERALALLFGSRMQSIRSVFQNAGPRILRSLTVKAQSDHRLFLCCNRFSLFTWAPQQHSQGCPERKSICQFLRGSGNRELQVT